VLAHDPAQVVVRLECIEAHAALPEQADFALGDPLGSAAGGVALEERTQLVEVVEVVRVVDAHRRAAVRRRDDEVLGLQHQQRLAHRGAADPELTCELLLLQPATGFEPALDDRLADQLGCGHAGVANERVVRRQHPRHASNHTCMQSGVQLAGSERGSRAATSAPIPARTAVASQNASQPACAASAPSGGVQTPETTNTTGAATAKE